MKEQETKIIVFKTDDEKVSVDAHFDEETVWLTNDDMANSLKNRGLRSTSIFYCLFRR